MAEFQWNAADADAVILQHQPRTAVYSSATGNVIVRQEADAMQEHDDLIYLTPQGALTVAWALIEEAHLVGLPSPSLSLMGEDQHWPPPQRRTEEPGALRARALDPNRPDTPGSEPGPLLKVMNEAAE